MTIGQSKLHLKKKNLLALPNAALREGTVRAGGVGDPGPLLSMETQSLKALLLLIMLLLL